MSNLYAKKVTELHVAHAIYLVALAQVQSARKEVSSVCQQGDMTDDERDVAMDGLLIANENARTAHDSLTVALASFIAWILNRTDSRMVRLAA